MNANPQPSSASSLPPNSGMSQRLIAGEITPAQFLGLSQEQLYALASRGYDLMVGGHTQSAIDILKGLTAAAPYDSVFHCHLAAAYVQADRFQEGLESYNRSIQLNIANVDALGGRSELLLREGKVAEALADIQAALQLDPEAKRETTQRARTALLLLQSMAETTEAAPSKQP
ncbi:BTAD domain-containing putative transcriptional regulator [Stigmatella sp. ncwal1]|uniref:BTAD domain-containing putative transcriptional regulator n=1 Tax=Stigmatella ashevillensis TaxID=2995309 RepID=A0ABT5DGS0_9BACT|nr:BTAD domain-containing putative transcriptional regulator [Stigmatella ashevillena]MDC0712857.1 BTAD domain-containing putative transcriptional regulator [Stigmatella ashevillena]